MDETSSSPSGEPRRGGVKTEACPANSGVRGTFASIPLTLTLTLTHQAPPKRFAQARGRGNIILDTNDFKYLLLQLECKLIYIQIPETFNSFTHFREPSVCCAFRPPPSVVCRPSSVVRSPLTTLSTALWLPATNGPKDACRATYPYIARSDYDDRPQADDLWPSVPVHQFPKYCGRPSDI